MRLCITVRVMARAYPTTKARGMHCARPGALIGVTPIMCIQGYASVMLTVMLIMLRGMRIGIQ